MKKLSYLIVLIVILGLVLTGCLLSNVGQVPTSEQSGITYLTKNPSPPGLVGLWHFDGSANDSSGNGHNGTVHGDPTYVPGVFGSALSVNGNDYIAVGNIGVTADWTVEFWAQLASTTQTIYYPVGLSPKVGTVWGSGTYMAFQWQENKWGVYDGTNTVPGSAVLTGTWYYMAVTKFGTTYTLYRDGAYENSGSLTDIDITDLNIGRRSDGNWYFNGLIDEVRIWDGALTGSNIEYNYSLRKIGIDIKPGSDSNSINLGSNGVVPVAILGKVDFDATTVDPSTVTLSGAEVKVKGHSGNAGSLEDVNDDGYPDLVVQVYTENLELATGAVNAILNAYTYAGPALTGSDVIQIVPPK